MEQEKILYVERVNEYTLISFDNNQQRVAEYSLAIFEKILDSQLFFRANKSQIINVSKIIEIRYGANCLTAIMKTGEPIRISKRRKKLLLDIIQPLKV